MPAGHHKTAVREHPIPDQPSWTTMTRNTFTRQNTCVRVCEPGCPRSRSRRAAIRNLPRMMNTSGGRVALIFCWLAGRQVSIDKAFSRTTQSQICSLWLGLGRTYAIIRRDDRHLSQLSQREHACRLISLQNLDKGVKVLMQSPQRIRAQLVQGLGQHPFKRARNSLQQGQPR